MARRERPVPHRGECFFRGQRRVSVDIIPRSWRSLEVTKFQTESLRCLGQGRKFAAIHTLADRLQDALILQPCQQEHEPSLPSSGAGESIVFGGCQLDSGVAFAGADMFGNGCGLQDGLDERSKELRRSEILRISFAEFILGASGVVEYPH